MKVIADRVDRAGCHGVGPAQAMAAYHVYSVSSTFLLAGGNFRQARGVLCVHFKVFIASGCACLMVDELPGGVDGIGLPVAEGSLLVNDGDEDHGLHSGRESDLPSLCSSLSAYLGTRSRASPWAVGLPGGAINLIHGVLFSPHVRAFDGTRDP